MHGIRQALLKAIVVVLVAVAWWMVYSSLNEWNARPERAVHLKSRPADLWPWLIQPASAVVYVGCSAILLIWPLVLCWHGKSFWQFVAMVVLGTVIGFSIFAIWPLNIYRPDFAGERFGESLMRGVFAFDQSANCFPSFHTFFAVLGALLVATHSESIWATAIAAMLAAAVLISTITTGQHYAIDVLGGSALAVFSFYALRAADVWKLASLFPTET